MKELSEEELRKCPDGFLEYGFNRSGGVFFFDRSRSVGVVCGDSRELKLGKGHYAFYECKPIPQPRESFDIAKYGWSGSDVTLIAIGVDDSSLIFSSSDTFDLNRLDAIAIAKHFGLTAEDLK